MDPGLVRRVTDPLNVQELFSRRGALDTLSLRSYSEWVQVTFQRYVHADLDMFEDAKYQGLTLPEQMRKLFELELEECEFPEYEIVRVRERRKDNPGLHFFEYLVRFPSLEGKGLKEEEVAAQLQKKQYDENGMSGFFWMGDVDFIELEKRFEAERTERIRLEKLAKVAGKISELLDELHDQCKTHLPEQDFELAEKYIDGIGDLFAITGGFGSSAAA